MPASVKMPTKVIRDSAFAVRLSTACEGNPHCPTGLHRGKQKWIYDNLLGDFGIKVSPEAVRKWFAGESRPRPNAMRAIAKLLDVDEAWLSLGIAPDMTPREQKRRNAVADGAVNIVAGMIQAGGGHIAFPEDGSAHIAAIIAGKHLMLDVVIPLALDRDKFRLTIKDNLKSKGVVVLIQSAPFAYRLLVLTEHDIRTLGHIRGDFLEMVVDQHGLKYRCDQTNITELTDIAEIPKALESE